MLKDIAQKALFEHQQLVQKDIAAAIAAKRVRAINLLQDTESAWG
jgi:hypothetical protein